jgi:hypothetical protein
VECSGTDFHVIGLEHDAALLAPELLQRQDEILEGFARAQSGAGFRRHINCSWMRLCRFEGNIRISATPSRDMAAGSRDAD